MEYTSVRYECLRPAQVKAIRDTCPIVYIPLGSLEWHSFHLPLGTDAFKAHIICCEAAQKYGGIVLPPYYQGLLGDGWGPEGWENYSLGYNDEDVCKKVMDGIVTALLKSQWKILVGVTGHDVAEQRDALGEAIAKQVDGTRTNGFSVMEGEMHTATEDVPIWMDHAGAWETSCMLHYDKRLVDLDELARRFPNLSEELNMDEPQGIGGFNPITRSSRELGEAIIKRCADLIGARAKGMLGELS